MPSAEQQVSPSRRILARHLLCGPRARHACRGDAAACRGVAVGKRARQDLPGRVHLRGRCVLGRGAGRGGRGRRPGRHRARRGGDRHFAGTDYQRGRRWAQQAIDVSIVAGSVQLSRDGKVIRVHPIRHDRARELGAFANPKGRPRRKNSAIGTVA